MSVGLFLSPLANARCNVSFSSSLHYGQW